MYSYEIRNIKSFKDSGEIVLKPLTIFVGKNSSGKSSLMRFPLVLKQTINSNSFENPIVFCGNILDYGNYKEVVNKRKNGDIEFDLTYDVEKDRHLLYTRYYNSPRRRKTPFNDVKKIKTTIKIKQSYTRMRITEYLLYTDNRLLLKISKDQRTSAVCLYQVLEKNQLIEEKHKYVVKKSSFRNYVPWIDEEELFRQVLEENELGETEKEYRFWHFLDDNDTINQQDYREQKVRNIIKTLDATSSLLDYIYRTSYDESFSTSYIGPFRESPARVYRESESTMLTVGVHGENISTILIRDYQNKKRLINEVSKWLRDTMGYSLSLKPLGKGSGYYQIVLEDNQRQKSNIMDVGYGISQVLPIVTQILNDKIYQSTITSSRGCRYTYIEQPEIHLHPAAQSELAVLFSNVISEKNRLIVETHSEHFIRKLEAIVADKTNVLNKDMVAIYYVDKDQMGDSVVEEMKLLDNGKFEKEWPTGFFDQAYLLSKELMEYSQF